MTARFLALYFTQHFLTLTYETMKPVLSFVPRRHKVHVHESLDFCVDCRNVTYDTTQMTNLCVHSKVSRLFGSLVTDLFEALQR